MNNKRLKNKKMLYSVASVAVIVMVVVGLLIFNHNKTSLSSSTAESSSSGELNKGSDSDKSGENKDQVSNESKSESSDTDTVHKSESENGTLISGMPTGREWLNEIGNNSQFKPIQDSVKNEESNQNSVSFPYQIPGTDLVVHTIGSYDGIYIEDGSDDEVSGVSAILVENKGGDLEFSEISVKAGDQMLNFNLSTLPSGADAVVLERDRQGYSGGTVKSVSASASDSTNFSLNDNVIGVSGQDGNSLIIENKTSSTIPRVRIFYKIKQPGSNSYVGGITYVTVVDDLEAGEKRTITPGHYANDASKVLMVKTYSEKD